LIIATPICDQFVLASSGFKCDECHAYRSTAHSRWILQEF
jgi:hypothetical protein